MPDTNDTADLNHRGVAPLSGLIALAAFLAGELVILSLTYSHGFEFECRAKAPGAFCGFLSVGVLRVISVLAAFGLFCLARPAVVRGLLSGLRPALNRSALGVHLLGFACVLAPWFFLSDQSSGAVFLAGAGLWLMGAVLAAVGAALALVPGPVWGAFLRAHALTLAGIVLIAGLAPEIAGLFQFAWRFDPLTLATFRASEAVLTGLGYTVESDVSSHLLGIEEFRVLVGRQCSGVEGFLLIGGFLAFYIWLFRDQLRFPNVWILLPIGIVFSWMFNVVRISALILTGHHISPDLAIGGFHSHAGWLMFTILAVGLAYGAHQIAWFRNDATTAARIKGDTQEVDAQIIPFIVFMASALLLSTFTEIPGLYYPIRFVPMVLVLWWFRDYLRGLDWRIDPLAALLGGLIGVAWVATAPAPDLEESALAGALAGLSGGVFAIWAITRVLGTSLLVPVIEELFFRGYVLRAIDTGSTVNRILAIAISSGLFAALHGRWMAAGLAGVVLALLVLRRGKIADAIWAHIIANTLIAAWAVWGGDWSVI